MPFVSPTTAAARAAASAASRAVYVVAAKRTPFGAFGGSLAGHTTTDLGVASTRAALASGKVRPEVVDAIVFGNVIQSSSDAAYLARHVGLQSGLSMETPALTINRLCGSGFESVIQGDLAIQTHQADVVVCGGAENMSMAPLQVDGNHVRFKGVNLGKGLQLRDSLWDGLTDAHIATPMGMTAENLAEKYNITREQCDEFAIRSQQLWAKAKEAGVFDLEMAPIEIETRKGTKIVDTDEHPRPDTTLEKISTLPPVFKKGTGVVTAANASGICDGAGTIILASEEAVQEHSLTPLARLVSHHVSGCDPSIMGIGPVSAIRGALEKTKGEISLDKVDHVEINEAFAAQCLSCIVELGLDLEEQTNIHGGAISMGHPLGASGSRILAHLVHQFAQKPQQTIHVGSACIGGGQGIAIVLERV